MLRTRIARICSCLLIIQSYISVPTSYTRTSLGSTGPANTPRVKECKLRVSVMPTDMEEIIHTFCHLAARITDGTTWDILSTWCAYADGTKQWHSATWIHRPTHTSNWRHVICPWRTAMTWWDLGLCKTVCSLKVVQELKGFKLDSQVEQQEILSHYYYFRDHDF